MKDGTVREGLWKNGRLYESSWMERKKQYVTVGKSQGAVLSKHQLKDMSKAINHNILFYYSPRNNTITICNDTYKTS